MVQSGIITPQLGAPAPRQAAAIGPVGLRLVALDHRQVGGPMTCAAMGHAAVARGVAIGQDRYLSWATEPSMRQGFAGAEGNLGETGYLGMGIAAKFDEPLEPLNSWKSRWPIRSQIGGEGSAVAAWLQPSNVWEGGQQARRRWAELAASLACCPGAERRALEMLL